MVALQSLCQHFPLGDHMGGKGHCSSTHLLLLFASTNAVTEAPAIAAIVRAAVIAFAAVIVAAVSTRED